MKEYELYYKGTGEEITKEDFDSIKFTRIPTALREIKKYKLPRTRRTTGKSIDGNTLTSSSSSTTRRLAAITSTA